MKKKAHQFFLKLANDKKLLFEIVLFFAIFCFFTTNTLYVSYPDEFVNLLAGKFINQGKIPYKEFFDHHLPFAWHFSSLLLFLSFNSFVVTRLFFSTILFFSFLVLALWIRKNYEEWYWYYMTFLLLYPITAVYYWFHLFLADSLSVFFFAIVFWVLFIQTVSKKINLTSLYLMSFLTFFLIFSSMGYLYLAFFLYLWELYLCFLNNKKNLLKFVGIALIPYIGYTIFILANGAFHDFYFANFKYNTELYISLPNYVRGNHFNPLKFALTLIYNFYSNYLPLLTKIKTLDLFLPVGILAGIGSLTLFILLLLRFPIIAFFYFFILSFSAPRSNAIDMNIFNLSETDYQSSVFIMLGITSAILSLYLLRRYKYQDIFAEDLRRTTHFLISIFLLFSTVFLIKNTYDKFFLRYTQKMPGIYDKSFTADFIDTIVQKNEYYWAGPYEPHEIFFVKNGNLPEKYISLLPQFRENEYLKTSFIEQFEKKPPKIIIYKQETSIFGTPSLEFGKFFLEWMKGKYTPIEKIKGIKVLQSPSSFNLKTDLYILNSEGDEILQRLKDSHFIE